MTAYTITYTINNFFYAYVLYRMVRIFYAERRVGKSAEIAAYLFYAVIISVTVFYDMPPIAYLSLSVTLFFLLTLLYASSFIKRFAATVLTCIIMICVELFINYVTGYYNQNLKVAMNYDSIFGITAITILTFFVVLLLENFINLKGGTKISPSYWISIILVPFGSLTLLLNNLSAHTNPFAIMIDSTIILGINILWFYTYDRISRLSKLEIENYMMAQQNKSYEQQLFIMQDSEKATQALKHDLKNHIAALEALSKDDTGASLYAESLLRQLQNKHSISNTGLLSLDSLINYKLGALQEDEIKVTYLAHVSPDLPIDDFDLTIILGNLIDNALEALKEVSNSQKELSLSICYDKGRLVIQLKNSYVGKLNKALNTTKADKQYHGIGLKNVRSVVHKYKGTMDISFDKGVFNVEIILYLFSQK